MDGKDKVVALKDRVGQARREAGLTQAAIEEHLNLPAGAVSKIESGTRSVTSTELAELAKICGRHLGWFFESQGDYVPRLRGDANTTAGRGDLAWLNEFAQAFCFLESNLGQPQITRVASPTHNTEDTMLRRKRVTFTAEKPAPTKVSFNTRDGKVSFTAEKPQPTNVSFLVKKKH